MGQVLHRGATTTEAIRRAIQHSQESLRTLAHRHGINPKTVAKWRKRCSVSDLRTGPKHPRSTVLTVQEEAVIIAFRRHTLLPLDDCLYALQATIPHLTALHCIAVWNGMASAGCRKWKAASREERSSSAIPLATSTSIWRKCVLRRASSISLWPSTAPRSLLSWSWSNVLTCRLRRDSSKLWSRLFLIASTPCSPTTASSSPICRRIARGQRPAFAAILLTGLSSAWHRPPADQTEPSLD